MVKLTGTSPYLAKDQVKANLCNRFIGRGSPASSTNQYRKDFGDEANIGDRKDYLRTDIVFISAEGNRRGRVGIDVNEIVMACEAGVTFITDTPYHRNRSYNIGEREVAALLEQQGYDEYIHAEYSLWKFPF